MNAVLDLAAVTRVHGEGATEVHALRGITLRVRPGELVAIMGPSGSGKSTLLNLAGGLDQPTGGSVRIEGTDLASLDASGQARIRRTSVGYVFQDFNLIPALTAAENVALPRELDGEKARIARRYALAALAEVGIEDLADRFPDEMSGGQQQRVAIARAPDPRRRAHGCPRHRHRRGDPAAAPRAVRRRRGGPARHPRGAARRVGRPGGLPA
jgi:putative ABC transport system ATP-binding protein